MNEIEDKKRKYDLEEWLINFAVMIIELIEHLPSTKSANHLAGQLLRSGTSPALNYGEAQSRESPNDSIHKIKVVLKELRETLVCLKIVYRTRLYSSEEKMKVVMKEADELVAIFVTSVKTAETNRIGKRK